MERQIRRRPPAPPIAWPQPVGRPLSHVATAGLLAKEIVAHGLGWVVRPRRRDRALVRAEYDRGTWRRLADARPWMTSPDLEAYINPRTAPDRTAKVGGRLVRVGSHDYYTYRTGVVRAVLQEFAAGESELVELGCGSGFNIFLLLAAGAGGRFTGLDVSSNAVRAARDISRRFDLTSRTDFDELDLLDGAHPNFARISGRVVFTYHCLEQLKHDTDRVLGNILAARPRRVLHFEPTTELLRLWQPMDLVNYLYIKRQDYQDNLLTRIRSIEQKGRLRVVAAVRLGFAPGPRHDPTLVCWEPVR